MIRFPLALGQALVSSSSKFLLSRVTLFLPGKLTLLQHYLLLSQYKKDVWIHNIHLRNPDVFFFFSSLAKVLIMPWKTSTEEKDGSDRGEKNNDRFFLMPVKSLCSIGSCLELPRLRRSGEEDRALFWSIVLGHEANEKCSTLIFRVGARTLSQWVATKTEIINIKKSYELFSQIEP